MNRSLIWLYGHCRAIGMTKRADNSPDIDPMATDIALFTADLAARLADEVASHDNTRSIQTAAQVKVLMLQDRLAEAIAALRRYGGHEDDCAGTAGYLDPRCTCGFAASLRPTDSAPVQENEGHG